MLYSAEANVFATNLTPELGTKVSFVVCANDTKEALDCAKYEFDKYCKRLHINHKNNFAYNNLVLK